MPQHIVHLESCVHSTNTLAFTVKYTGLYLDIYKVVAVMKFQQKYEQRVSTLCFGTWKQSCYTRLALVELQKCIKNAKTPLHFFCNFKILHLNPLPTRLCHVIYCCGNKSYPCLVGIGLKQFCILKFHNYHQLKFLSGATFFFFNSIYGSPT